MTDTVNNKKLSYDDEAAKAVFLKMTEYFNTSNATSIDDAEAELISISERVCGVSVSGLQARRLYSRGKHLCS